MEQRLNGKIAIVTGSGRGIGKAVALRLAREGADVVVADVDLHAAEQTVREVRDIKQRALAYQIDIARISQIRPMVDRVVAEFDRIDIVVNVAGVAETKPFVELTEEGWNRIIDTNLKGTAFCIRAAGEQMIKQVPDEVKAAGRADRSFGKIVNFSSISGRRGRAMQPAYAASKAGVISITQSAALAFAPYNINVNAVSPGVIPTLMWDQIDLELSRIFGVAPGESMKSFIERIPLKRAGSPEDVAGAVAFLCSSDADYVTGQTLNVDGGFEMS